MHGFNLLPLQPVRRAAVMWLAIAPIAVVLPTIAPAPARSDNYRKPA